MTEMSMNKAIHGAFRRDLNRFIGALGSFPPGDLTRAKQLGKAWANFDDQLNHHHKGEHEIAWPTLVSIGVNPDLLATMDAEHDTMAAALSETRGAIGDLVRTAGLQESQAALAAVQKLQTVATEHLDHEEGEFEALMVEKRETPEMQAMGRKFGKVSPARGGRFFEWVLDGATPDEQAAVKRDVPGPVLAILTGIFGGGYRKGVAPVWKS
ncbi:MAG TPA: hemerythrin domain-containing protein [Nocardioidaceae bacterium]|nr:hemerythrin domain-containing protein [Nocardioidaceae bacterium]